MDWDLGDKGGVRLDPSGWVWVDPMDVSVVFLSW